MRGTEEKQTKRGFSLASCVITSSLYADLSLVLCAVVIVQDAGHVFVCWRYCSIPVNSLKYFVCVLLLTPLPVNFLAFAICRKGTEP
jgi:hypothetical protein